MRKKHMNKIRLIGHLGKTPEGKYTNNGTPVTKFTLAVTRKFKTSGGETKEETEWFTIITWNHLAEICNKYLEKGKLVYIEGRLSQRKYTDREGIQRTAIEVVANEMEMLSPRQATDRQADAESDEEVEAFLAELEQQAES
jgi:single-strand DNA-binding protein